jgi:hypothetical protein
MGDARNAREGEERAEYPMPSRLAIGMQRPLLLRVERRLPKSRLMTFLLAVVEVSNERLGRG